MLFEYFYQTSCRGTTRKCTINMHTSVFKTIYHMYMYMYSMYYIFILVGGLVGGYLLPLSDILTVQYHPLTGSQESQSSLGGVEQSTGLWPPEWVPG